MLSRFFVVAVLLICAAGCSGASTTAPTSSAPYSQIDLVVGSGATAGVGNKVTISYTGWLYDASQTDGKGKQFDSNSSFSFTVGAGQVIKGWDQGVVGMRVGGRRRLIIPPELAYGGAGAGSGLIPSNATLVFDITLISVV